MMENLENIIMLGKVYPDRDEKLFNPNPHCFKTITKATGRR
jgi:hypothetical protein